MLLLLRARTDSTPAATAVADVVVYVRPDVEVIHVRP